MWSPFPLLSRGELSLLSVWKTALEMFVHNKTMINSKHEFAIVILRDKAEWVSVPNLAAAIVVKYSQSLAEGVVHSSRFPFELYSGTWC